MHSLRQRPDGTFYLTYDRERRFNNNLRGVWEWCGPQESTYTDQCVKVNEEAGLLCCEDDEGNVRVLVCTE